jgi:hypothetical protein
MKSDIVELWVTRDAGHTWRQADLPTVTGVPGAHCTVSPALDGSHRVTLSVEGLALDQDTQPCAHSQYLLSEDDGATWRPIRHASILPVSTDGGACQLWPTARRLFMWSYSYTGSGNAFLERSDDDGATWRAIALTSLAPLAPPIGPDGDCFMVVSARHLFLDIDVNSNGNQSQSILERSDDVGRTWQRADHGLEALLFVPRAPWFALPLDATGEALVTSDTINGRNDAHADLWVTHDAGAHWQRVTSDKLPDPSFDVGPNGALMTEPAPADTSRACHCVVVVNTFNVLNQRPYSALNQRLYSSRDLAHWTPLPPLPVKGTSAQVSGVYTTLGMTGDGRLLALGPDPEEGMPSQIITNGLFDKASPALWMWDTHTGRWEVARTRLPCVDPQNCYGRQYFSFGVSVSARAPGQPPGTWFWIGAAGAGFRHDFRVFIPAA